MRISHRMRKKKNETTAAAIRRTGALPQWLMVGLCVLSAANESTRRAISSKVRIVMQSYTRPDKPRPLITADDTLYKEIRTRLPQSPAISARKHRAHLHNKKKKNTITRRTAMSAVARERIFSCNRLVLISAKPLNFTPRWIAPVFHFRVCDCERVLIISRFLTPRAAIILFLFFLIHYVKSLAIPFRRVIIMSARSAFVYKQYTLKFDV